MIVFLGRKKMKDKKPRASYRRGRGVAMAPIGRGTVGPKMPRRGGGSKAPNAVPVPRPTTPVSTERRKVPTVAVKRSPVQAPVLPRSKRPKPTMPVSTGRPKVPTLVKRGGRPQAPTFPVARGGRGRLQNAPTASPVMQQAAAARGGPSEPPTAAVMRPRGNRQMLNKGGKAGYGSVQEMEKACMVKSDHNPSMRQK